MATSPDFFGRATSALADTALDQLGEAVLVVDAYQSQLPVILANAAARRCLAGEGAAGQVIRAPLANVLGAACAAQASEVPHRQTLTWRFQRGELSVETTIRLLASGSGQRLVMLTFAPPGPEAPALGAVDQLPIGRREPVFGSAGDAVDDVAGWLKLSMKMAHMQAWRWDQARNSIEVANLDDSRAQSPSEFSDMETLLARVHPKDRAAVQCAIDQGMAGEPEVRVEFELLGGDGRYRAYATTARPLLDGPTPRGLVGVIQDVTARREFERRLRRSKELLSATTNNTSDMLCLLDTALRVRFTNRSLNGLTKGQTVGRDIGALLPPAVRAAVLEKLHRVLETGEAATFEFESIDEEGARSLENHAVLVRNAGVISGISISMRDITERKRLEQEILNVSGRERQSIGRDLHDGLGQELTGIALMLRGLASRVQHHCPEVAHNVNEIVAHVNHSIEAARALAWGTLPVRTETGGLITALRALAERSRDLHGLDVTFRSDVCAEFALSETNASHLYRIAQEALTNAARHGRATLVDIFLAATAGAFSLRITDNGEGIVHGAQPSSGMGLKIMKYRADMIGAKLGIEPNEPHGAVITVAG